MFFIPNLFISNWTLLAGSLQQNVPRPHRGEMAAQDLGGQQEEDQPSQRQGQVFPGVHQRVRGYGGWWLVGCGG